MLIGRAVHDRSHGKTHGLCSRQTTFFQASCSVPQPVPLRAQHIDHGPVPARKTAVAIAIAAGCAACDGSVDGALSECPGVQQGADLTAAG